MSNAVTVTVGPQLNSVLAIAYKTRKPVLLEGPSGIGKSECVRNAAEHSLGIACTALDLSLLEPPDLLGLPATINGRTSYAIPATLPTDGAGILLLEELNRAERYIRQPVLQLLSARRLNEYVLPEGWSVIAAINPERAEYDVDTIDKALLDRFLRLRVSADRDTWLLWAETAGVHSAVITLAKSHDRLLEDVSPRTWKHVSDLLHYFSRDDSAGEDVVQACIGGYLPEAWRTALLATRSQWNAEDGIDAERLLTRYGRDESLQRRIASLRSEGRTDVLEQLTWRIVSIMDQCDLKDLANAKRFSLDSFERFIDDLPGDSAERAQLAFGYNQSGIGLLHVCPSVFLQDTKCNGSAEFVKDWMSRPRRRHRAWALATGLAYYLDTSADKKAVRECARARRNLGALLRQLDYPHDRNFAKCLDKLEIEAILPRRGQ